MITARVTPRAEIVRVELRGAARATDHGPLVVGVIRREDRRAVGSAPGSLVAPPPRGPDAR